MNQCPGGNTSLSLLPVLCASTLFAIILTALDSKNVQAYFLWLRLLFRGAWAKTVSEVVLESRLSE